jgi:hypothetical protein
MSVQVLDLTTPERVALEAIRENRPELFAGVSKWLTDVLDDLIPMSQGHVVSESDAEDLLVRLRDELVTLMMGEMEPWGEDEHLRKPAVDLLIRHLLAGSREAFVRQVVTVMRN